MIDTGTTIFMSSSVAFKRLSIDQLRSANLVISQANRKEMKVDGMMVLTVQISRHKARHKCSVLPEVGRELIRDGDRG